MNHTRQGQAVNNGEENVINILVIRQDDISDNAPECVTSNHLVTQHHGGSGRLVSIPYVLQEGDRNRTVMDDTQAVITPDSACQSLDSRNTSVITSRTRPVLYKSQSFTLAGNRPVVEFTVAADDLRVSKAPDMHTTQSTKKLMQLKATMPIRNKNLPGSLNEARCCTVGHEVKFVKHKTINIPFSQVASEKFHSPLSTSTPRSIPSALLVTDLRTSSIKNLTATTPDSGFCTPSFENAEAALSSSSSASPTSSHTPRSSRIDTGRKKGQTLIPHGLNQVVNTDEGDIVWQENESPLDTSLESVQWLEAYTVGDTVQPLFTTPPNQSTSIQGTPSSDEVQITGVDPPPLKQFPSMTPLPVIMAPPMGDVGLSRANNTFQNVLAFDSPQKRKALEELQLNKCYQPVGYKEPVVPELERPNHSYMDLIKMAMKESEDGQMTLREILAWIEEHFPYFKHKAKQSWKSSIRHNLSLHQDFMKVEEKKHGGKWKMVEGAKKFIHRLPKPPVVKQPVGPKVPAATVKKSRRVGPQPILPKSVPYALVPISLAPYGSGVTGQQIQTQPLQMMHQESSSHVGLPQIPMQTPHQQQQLQRPLQQHEPIQIRPRQEEQKQMLQPHNTYSQQQYTYQDHLQNHQTFLPKPSSSLLHPQSARPQHKAASVLQRSISKTISLETTSNSLNDPMKKKEMNQRQEDSQPVLKNLACQTFSGSTSMKRPGSFSQDSCSQDYTLEPVDIQIHENRKLKQKKIVFYLKQQQANCVDLHSDSSLVSQHFTRECGPSGDQNPPNVSLQPSVRGKRICKLIDKIQRSKSFDVANTNLHLRQQHRGGKSFNSRRGPVLNLASVLKEDNKAAETIGKMLQEDYDDDDGHQQISQSSDFSHTPQRPVHIRPDSAPTSSLIEQAWQQAWQDCGDSDAELLNSPLQVTEMVSCPQIHDTADSETSCEVPQEKLPYTTVVTAQMINSFPHPSATGIAYDSASATLVGSSLVLQDFTSLDNHQLFQHIDIADIAHSEREPQTIKACEQTTTLSNQHTRQDGIDAVQTLKATAKSFTSHLFPVNSETGDLKTEIPEVVIHDAASDVTSGFSAHWLTKQDTQQNRLLDVTAVSQPLSASRIVFSKALSTQRESLSAGALSTFSSVITHPSILSSSEQLSPPNKKPSIAQSVTLSVPQPPSHKVKSRRKQVHVPLRTEISPRRERGIIRSNTSYVNHDDRSFNETHTSAGTSTSIYQTEIPHLLVTPPCGTNYSISSSSTGQSTSSPNSEDPPPLDFETLFMKYTQAEPGQSYGLSITSQLSSQAQCKLSPNVIATSSLPVFSSSLSLTPPSASAGLSHIASSPPLLLSSASALSPSDLMYPVLKSVGDTSVMSFMPSLHTSPSSTAITTLARTTSPFHVSPSHPEPPILSQPNLDSSSPTSLLNHSPNSHTLSHFLALTCTPPAGNQPLPASSSAATPAHESQLSHDLTLQAPTNSSGLLDSSLFDNLDTFIQNSFFDS